MATDSQLAGGPPRVPGVLRIRSYLEGDAHVIALAGELDLATAADVERALERLELIGAPLIAVDLRELTFIDSSGIRLIEQAAQRRSSPGEGRLLVVRGSDAVQRRFDLRDLSTTLPFVDRLQSEARRAATRRRSSQAALAASVRELRTRRRRGVQI